MIIETRHGHSCTVGTSYSIASHNTTVELLSPVTSAEGNDTIQCDSVDSCYCEDS